MIARSFCLLIAAGLAYGDSITPSTYSAHIASVGGTATLRKTVTISETSTSPVDLFFLTDTTGSMGGAISNVRDGFSTVVGSVSGIASDARYGAGQYKDEFDSFHYQQDQDLTADPAAVQAAINGWFASGGGDTPEGNLHALEQVATGTSWREGSQRILVWTGDAPGHDPSAGSTEESATNALKNAGIQVISISSTSGPGIDQTGQATRISNATGGSFLGSFSSGALVDEIISALTTTISTYSLVELTVEGLPSGIDVAFSPASYSGSFDRSESRDFVFDTTFTGLAPGTYNFNIAARVDGRIVALEEDTITVGGVVPEPSTYAMVGGAAMALLALRRRVKA